MKNIHVLPTDKPSRLHLQNGNLVLHRLQYTLVAQHIYITNDEEINQNTKPCWCLNTIKKTWNDDVVYFQGAMPQYHYIGFKKIILTDNPDLIKDGIQAIGDEFLEFFVENPSCEEIKINYEIYKEGVGLLTSDWRMSEDDKYKIIIPKREPKQETLDEVAERESEKRYPVLTHKTPDDSPYIESKKTFKNGVNFGAKWQQQQNKNLYSEKEVLYILEKTEVSKTSILQLGIKEWFEQFKKK